jgi:hypothetical protein
MSNTIVSNPAQTTLPLVDPDRQDITQYRASLTALDRMLSP